MGYVPPSVDASSLEDQYIGLFKAGNSKGIKLLPYVRALVHEGRLTWDDVAKFLNDVVAVVEVGYDQIASAFNSDPTVFLESPIPHFTVDEAALILNSANFEVEKAASVVNSANLTVDRAASIFNHANLAVEKIASICDHANLTADKAASIFNSTNLDISKAASIFDNTNLTVIKAASIINSANLTVARVTSIFSNVNLSNSRAKSIASELATNTVYTNYDNIEAVFKGTSLLADDAQEILYSMAFESRLVDILTGTAGDLTVSSSTSISGVNRYGTLIVQSGITLTINGQPGGIICKTLSNSGTIAKSATGGAGGAPGRAGAGAGGDGGGGLITFADSLANGGVISADGANGGDGSTVTATGTPGDGGAGAFYRVGSDAAGSGGYGGAASTGNRGPGGVNGGGGGGGHLDGGEGGAGDGSSYTTFNTYADLAEEVRKAAIDWVIVNVFGRSPSSTEAFPNAYGSGGGAGLGHDTYGADGGGGGGGGEIISLCLSLNNTGTMRANGGNGGNGGTEGSYDSCGGGGGGGIVYALYKTLVSAGTLSAAGGVHGPTADYHGTDGTAGTATAQAV